MSKPRPPLPPACSMCSPFAGLHRNYGTDDRPRLARCDCARGKALGMGTKWGKATRKKAARKAVYDGKAAASSDQ